MALAAAEENKRHSTGVIASFHRPPRAPPATTSQQVYEAQQGLAFRAQKGRNRRNDQYATEYYLEYTSRCPESSQSHASEKRDSLPEPHPIAPNVAQIMAVELHKRHYKGE